MGWKELDWALEAKNKYAMHNNGGRNEALRLAFEMEKMEGGGEGKKTTRWAIPLDSNCVFTEAGLVGLARSIVQAEEEREALLLEQEQKEEEEEEEKTRKPKEYIVVPMARLLDNEEFFKWNRNSDWSRFEEGTWMEATKGTLDRGKIDRTKPWEEREGEEEEQVEKVLRELRPPGTSLDLVLSFPHPSFLGYHLFHI